MYCSIEASKYLGSDSQMSEGRTRKLIKRSIKQIVLYISLLFCNNKTEVSNSAKLLVYKVVIAMTFACAND